MLLCAAALLAARPLAQNEQHAVTEPGPRSSERVVGAEIAMRRTVEALKEATRRGRTGLQPLLQMQMRALVIMSTHYVPTESFTAEGSQAEAEADGAPETTAMASADVALNLLRQEEETVNQLPADTRAQYLALVEPVRKAQDEVLSVAERALKMQRPPSKDLAMDLETNVQQHMAAALSSNVSDQPAANQTADQATQQAAAQQEEAAMDKATNLEQTVKAEPLAAEVNGEAEARVAASKAAQLKAEAELANAETRAMEAQSTTDYVKNVAKAQHAQLVKEHARAQEAKAVAAKARAEAEEEHAKLEAVHTRAVAAQTDMELDARAAVAVADAFNALAKQGRTILEIRNGTASGSALENLTASVGLVGEGAAEEAEAERAVKAEAEAEQAELTAAEEARLAEEVARQAEADAAQAERALHSLQVPTTEPVAADAQPVAETTAARGGQQEAQIQQVLADFKKAETAERSRLDAVRNSSAAGNGTAAEAVAAADS